MARWNPKSKASATVTARVLRAAAADLRNVAEGFDRAAELYRRGDSEQATFLAQGALSLARMVFTVVSRIKK